MIREKDILEAIYNARKAKGLKQEYIALLLKMTRPNYGKKEAGKVPITLDELEIISDILSLNFSNISQYILQKKKKKIA